MKSRRRISIVLLIAASVFLCLLASCGIPTPINASVSFTPDISSSDSSISFTAKYTGDAVGDYGKVGLILLYYPDKAAVDSSDNTQIIKEFASKYKISTYDGRVIDDLNDNERIFEINPSQKDPDISYLGNVYAFELDDEPVSSPTYTQSMSTTGDFTSIIQLDYIKENGVGKIIMTVDGVEQSSFLTINEDINLSMTSYLNVYAAISVQSSQFSTIFWSSLTNVGTIKTN